MLEIKCPANGETYHVSEDLQRFIMKQDGHPQQDIDAFITYTKNTTRVRAMVDEAIAKRQALVKKFREFIELQLCFCIAILFPTRVTDTVTQLMVNGWLRYMFIVFSIVHIVSLAKWGPRRIPDIYEIGTEVYRIGKLPSLLPFYAAHLAMAIAPVALVCYKTS